ncbi:MULTISPECIES: lysozyme inhibitor LprI family protein [Bhargavaea]|uniref:Lysozyme inhibitor LprI family protein n=1 Tax=Bhargavaea changchunensis TaxID=2134037 RepID=A0ABW2NJ97_9BACL|nr:lysozyme inhibitor LprI family protein [Bhargavaea sp. CC-171006]
MRKGILMVMLTAAILILGACNNSSAESDHETEHQPSAGEAASAIKEGSSHEELNTEQEGTASDSTIINHKNDQEKTVSRASGDSEAADSKKEEYLQRLKDTKAEADQLKETDSSTFALKKVANDKWEIWDDLLNEIYGVLQEQLPQDEMDRLREEQRNWIKYRDETALEESQKYKGGTHEHLEYVTVLARLTEERCIELVEVYMM